MLDAALKFLVEEANAFLKQRGLSVTGVGEVVLGQVVDDAGKWATLADNIGFSLVNVEEERALKAQMPSRASLNGNQFEVPPELKLNLTLLVHVRPSNASKYEQSLRFLSNALSFFQASSTFSPASHPGLDPRVERLSVEMLSLSTDQLNQLWTYLGGKYLPSAAYRLRMLVLQDQQPSGVGKPITHLEGGFAHQ